MFVCGGIPNRASMQDTDLRPGVLPYGRCPPQCRAVRRWESSPPYPLKAAISAFAKGKEE